MEFFAEKTDIAVIGAGHAGIEAALAAARLGCTVNLFTINMDSVGNLPCNPSIGGTAKGHLVREIDALGGEMGKLADKATIQSRMLNRGKGPAVHSLRAQVDRRKYMTGAKHVVELQEGLTLRQAEISELRRTQSSWELVTVLGAVYEAACVIIATGTYLGGRIYVGDVSFESGPDGMFPATRLSESIKRLGIPLRRFKTGTPARVLKSSIDFSELEVQHGDESVVPFSYETDKMPRNDAVCYVTWTNERTKEIILQNLHRSPLYGGKIEGIGPRYCPSIEDKIVRFTDKPRHQLFIEPCGTDTEEMYLQGASSSLPEDVQISLYHSIKGLENMKIMRNAYAIEYDCIDPVSLKATLEFKDFSGLYGAGQFNGSSGYEEAAAQGLIAGINAARRVKGETPFILDRASSYIGTLIDDLVTKGVQDPYRMMTSRSEYRLVLRQDNADERLTPLGYELGLISEKRYKNYLERVELKNEEIKRTKTTVFAPTQALNRILVSRETSPVTTGVRMYDLLKRPMLDYDALSEVDTERPRGIDDILFRVETEIKYEGYIKKQESMINEMRRLEAKALPHDTDYNTINGLRLEAREKLNKVRPENIGQASRISGVSPADISVLIIWIAGRERGNEQA